MEASLSLIPFERLQHIIKLTEDTLEIDLWYNLRKLKEETKWKV